MAGGENICGKNECSFWRQYALWLCLTIVPRTNLSYRSARLKREVNGPANQKVIELSMFE